MGGPGGTGTAGASAKDDTRSAEVCGLNVNPDAIIGCYYTDCFESLHAFGERRRLGTNLGYSANCGNVGNARRRLASGPDAVSKDSEGGYLGFYCEDNPCDTTPTTPQFRYWEKTYKPDCDKDNCDDGMVDGGSGNSQCNYGQWSGDATKVTRNEGFLPIYTPKIKACIYDSPPANCHCKTLFCRVAASTQESDGHFPASRDENNKDEVLGEGNFLLNEAGEFANPNGQTRPECNLVVRIEDTITGITMGDKKYVMWLIFGLSSMCALLTTWFYYCKYGDELVKEGSEGSGGSKGSQEPH